MTDERNSEFGMHERTDVVELETIHNTTPTRFCEYSILTVVLRCINQQGQTYSRYARMLVLLLSFFGTERRTIDLSCVWKRTSENIQHMKNQID